MYSVLFLTHVHAVGLQYVYHQQLHVCSKWYSSNQIGHIQSYLGV